ncbi:DNA-binding response regulator [Paenibacillus psychroresistens]|uniref:DNA-binding response regulator n=1 Tax=Paenibacillus psychroresistens TaxID=1778678 RepID=A0A6B8RIC1_9BACL|nr:response regulator transcription factor [Paenibacillus psychroresistens]QGQ95484.1 DNA-binding response regulator [Paenibacillus psychroresistens]
MKPYRILIVDDHPLARQAVRALLEDEADYIIIGEATNGLDAIKACEQLQPDVVLLDIHMPGMNGLETTRLIKEQNARIKVVILSVSDAVTDLFTAIKNGAQGYLLKDMDPMEWVNYLGALLEEDSDIPKMMADRLFYRFKTGLGIKEDPIVQLLTPREHEILALVAKGITNRQIAESLFIAENTVKNHIKNLLEKLSFDNRVQLAAFAVKNERL